MNIVFHVELRVQNAETEDHIEAISESLRRAAGLLHSDCALILGEASDPKLEMWGETLTGGRFDIDLPKPEEVL
jgi:hypothetical protein